MIQNPVFVRSSHWNVEGKQDKTRLDALKKSTAGLFILFLLALLATAPALQAQNSTLEISDANPLAMPEVGAYGLRVLTPTVVELTLIGSKDAYPARPEGWDFIVNQVASLPPALKFAVTANGQPVAVQAVGFKRRPIYAPEKRDLRIGNHIYLTLATPVGEGQVQRMLRISKLTEGNCVEEVFDDFSFVPMLE